MLYVLYLQYICSSGLFVKCVQLLYKVLFIYLCNKKTGQLVQ